MLTKGNIMNLMRNLIYHRPVILAKLQTMRLSTIEGITLNQ